MPPQCAPLRLPFSPPLAFIHALSKFATNVFGCIGKPRTGDAKTYLPCYQARLKAKSCELWLTEVGDGLNEKTTVEGWCWACPGIAVPCKQIKGFYLSGIFLGLWWQLLGSKFGAGEFYIALSRRHLSLDKLRQEESQSLPCVFKGLVLKELYSSLILLTSLIYFLEIWDVNPRWYFQ